MSAGGASFEPQPGGRNFARLSDDAQHSGVRRAMGRRRADADAELAIGTGAVDLIDARPGRDTNAEADAAQV